MAGSRQTRRQERLAGQMLGIVGALVVGVVLVGALAIGLAQQQGSSPDAGGDHASPSPDGGGAFPIVAYQGASFLGGDEIDFTSLLGTGTPVVLNFWAGQCPPCRAEMPAFQRVHDRYASDFLLVGVDIGPFIGLGTRQSAVDLLGELGITYPAAYAVDGRAVQDYDVLGMPTTIFYDGRGIEVGRHSGLLTEEAFESRVRELVGLSA